MGGRTIFQKYGFRACAIGITCSLAVAVIAHMHIFDASEDAASRSMRYDLAWTGTNGRIEFAQLEMNVARFVALGTKSDWESARLFYDIVRSRMRTWSSGGFRHFIELSPGRTRQFEIILKRIEDLKADFERLNEPEAQRHIFETLAELAPMIDEIGTDAHTTSVVESAAVREDLRHQQQRQRILVLLLLASAASVLVFTVLQNRSLRAAHTSVAKHADKLLFLTRHDALTKLPNRSAFADAYEAALQAKRPGERILIAAIDLDGFKLINDLLGHPAGDALLITVSKLFASKAAQADLRNIVCRVGGDEFLALIWTSDDPTLTLDFAESILATLEHPVETPYGAMMISASVGVSASDVAIDEDLITNADLALTEAKTRGKGIALAFQPDMLIGLKRRLRLEADLRAAIMRGEIVLYYQPQVDLMSGQLVGLEALVRWCHPELGWVSPAEFIPIAESSGEIVKIGRFVLAMACRDAASFLESVTISVNLSVLQILKDDIIGVVKEVLASSGLPPARLTLEITETVVMNDSDKVLDALQHLKTLGVCISLDDFGTGYSALSYLTKFRWDELKIDRSFIGRAWCDPMNLTIIQAVKVFAREMNAKVTVEGVETEEQLRQLREIGCDAAQGYLFGRPAPLSELQPMLLRRSLTALIKSDTTAELEHAPSGRLLPGEG